MRIEDSLNSFQYFSIQRAFKAPVLKSRVVPCSIKMHIYHSRHVRREWHTDCNQVSCKNQLHITFLFYCNFSRNNRKEVNFFFFKLTYGSNSYMLGIACLWRITYENSIATKRYIFLKIMNCSLAVF